MHITCLPSFLYLRFGKRRAPRPRAIPRGPGPANGSDQYSPLENGCDGSPTATQAPTNGVNGSARSSPLYISSGKNFIFHPDFLAGRLL